MFLYVHVILAAGKSHIWLEQFCHLASLAVASLPERMRMRLVEVMWHVEAVLAMAVRSHVSRTS
jgi:hypothetical protein